MKKIVKIYPIGLLSAGMAIPVTPLSSGRLKRGREASNCSPLAYRFIGPVTIAAPHPFPNTDAPVANVERTGRGVPVESVCSLQRGLPEDV